MSRPRPQRRCLSGAAQHAGAADSLVGFASSLAADPLSVRPPKRVADPFREALGVEEDAATGGACAARVGAMASKPDFGGTACRPSIQQGVSMGRRCEIEAEACKSDGVVTSVSEGGASLQRKRRNRGAPVRACLLDRRVRPNAREPLGDYLRGRAFRRFARTRLRLLVTGFVVSAASNKCRMPCSNTSTALSKAPSCPTRTIATDRRKSNDGGRNTSTVSRQFSLAIKRAASNPIPYPD